MPVSLPTSVSTVATELVLEAREIPAPIESAEAPVPATSMPSDLFRLGYGIVSLKDLSKEIRELSQGQPYRTQIVPSDTDIIAQREAELWSRDAKQMYVAAAYWHTPLLGLTKHVFYSPGLHSKFIVQFRVFSKIVKRRILPASDQYRIAYDLLRGAQDAYSYDLRAASRRARSATYRPSHGVTVAALIHPIVVGPCWVFLNNADDQVPVVAIKAKDGGVYRQGDAAFEVLKLLVLASSGDNIYAPNEIPR